jgi:hypothetical protein
MTPISDEDPVAPHIVGVLLAVAALVIGTRSVDFFLKPISAAKVIRMPGPPLLIGLPLLLVATNRLAAGFLPLLEPWMGMKPTTTERTPPPLGHTLLLPRTS